MKKRDHAHDWQLIDLKAVGDDSAFATQWCRICGTLRFDAMTRANAPSMTYWKPKDRKDRDNNR